VCHSEHSTAQHSTAQHSTAQHSTAQHSTAQHSTAQHSTAQHSTAHQLFLYPCRALSRRALLPHGRCVTSSCTQQPTSFTKAACITHGSASHFEGTTQTLCVSNERRFTSMHALMRSLARMHGVIRKPLMMPSIDCACPCFSHCTLRFVAPSPPPSAVPRFQQRSV
jgi:hypothetical protein